MTAFFSPGSLGTAPFSSCFARMLAMTTNSNRFSLGALCMSSSTGGLKAASTYYFRLNVLMIALATGRIDFTFARSASTIDFNRSTAASSSSFTTTYS